MRARIAYEDITPAFLREQRSEVVEEIERAALERLSGPAIAQAREAGLQEGIDRGRQAEQARVGGILEALDGSGLEDQAMKLMQDPTLQPGDAHARVAQHLKRGRSAADAREAEARREYMASLQAGEEENSRVLPSGDYEEFDAGQSQRRIDRVVAVARRFGTGGARTVEPSADAGLPGTAE